MRILFWIVIFLIDVWGVGSIIDFAINLDKHKYNFIVVMANLIEKII